MEWSILPIAYLAGSVSFSLLVVASLEGRDLREMGSGNAGATNVLRSVGSLPALGVLLLDIAKGAVPIVLGRRLGVAGPLLGAAAVAAVLGHMYPVFHRFRGGKGVATAVGALGAAHWQLLLPAGIGFVAVLVTTRYVSLASMIAVSLSALFAWSGEPGSGPGSVGSWLAPAATTIALLVIWRHRDNIARLRHRREPRLGRRREELS